jgi:hypothetical protein
MANAEISGQAAVCPVLLEHKFICFCNLRYRKQCAIVTPSTTDQEKKMNGGFLTVEQAASLLVGATGEGAGSWADAWLDLELNPEWTSEKLRAWREERGLYPDAPVFPECYKW